jgi:hypothetical protein
VVSFGWKMIKEPPRALDLPLRPLKLMLLNLRAHLRFMIWMDDNHVGFFTLHLMGMLVFTVFSYCYDLNVSDLSTTRYFYMHSISYVFLTTGLLSLKAS